MRLKFVKKSQQRVIHYCHYCSYSTALNVPAESKNFSANVYWMLITDPQQQPAFQQNSDINNSADTLHSDVVALYRVYVCT